MATELPGRTIVRSAQAILCDFDNVLRRWDRLESRVRTIELEAQSPGAFSKCVFSPVLMQPAILGNATHQWWVANARVLLEQACGARAADSLIDCWDRDRGEIDSEMVELLHGLKGDGWVLALATNATDRLHSDLVALGIAELFDHVVSSADMGCAKPDGRFFLEASKRIGVGVGECILVDDDHENVASARRSGMKAVLYESVDAVRGSLKAL